MKLLIDNYDSFTYNLYQQVGALAPDIQVYKNDEIDCSMIAKMNPSHIFISPGPGSPKDAGISLKLVQKFTGKIPILGICMGIEVIAAAFGAKIIHAEKLMHGKTSLIQQTMNDPLFDNCPPNFKAARYHSLVIDPQTLPPFFYVTAKASDNSIMSISNAQQKIFGVQFHPESIMTSKTIGNQIIRNFLKIK
ncbi:anthranilate synthase component II [Liquorilactobacillus capillatus]|uniref:Anthranilate synthase, component II n=1 Tax=Liquorilactobacillus capillatus DSM 19910 TaxID=1423731 RepID=A0A0R1M810_9LACO|nr:aminodeoxychorismate/anthranilate synthase component II [Liquorilactobacillus capillatus]KRL01828.1 anthranilate synthase, component II [Liquorilactobacillus capillatus DSM 19910]